VIGSGETLAVRVQRRAWSDGDGSGGICNGRRKYATTNRLAFSRPRAQEGQGECLGGSTEKEAGVDKTECALQNSHWDQIADIAS